MAHFHKQVRLEAGGFADDVDERLAPLLREVWLAGIETISSCEDASESVTPLLEDYPHLSSYVEQNRGRAYVDFAELEGVERFLTLIARGGPSGDMRERMRHWITPGKWTTLASIHDFEDDEDTYEALLFQLSLPRGDLAEAERCLRRGREAEYAEAPDASHAYAVERLRDVTRNRAAVATNVVGDLPPAGEPGAAEALDDRAQGTYRIVRPMEDAALRALADVYLPSCDHDAVIRAIDEAGAGWLYPVLLERALDSVAVDGDGA